MPLRTDTLPLERLALRSGEARRLDLGVPVAGLSFAGTRYDASPVPVEARLDVSRTAGSGYALRLRFTAELAGPCMRCLEPASPRFDVDVREVHQPGGGDELLSPYVDAESELDVGAWARDAFALTIPEQIVCRPDCAGLCPVCGENLNDAPDHAHERPPDPRWAALRDLELP